LLPTNKTLNELGLVPAAKIYVSWKKPWNGKDYIRQDVLQQQQRKTDSNAGPALPKSVPVLSKTSNDEGDDEDKKPAAATSETNKRKKTKAEKEASMLARMLGK
jgi:hypothetical protein